MGDIMGNRGETGQGDETGQYSNESRKRKKEN